MTQLISFGRGLGLILVLDAALLLSVLSRAPLSRIDEGQIAEVSREMAAGGDWATPRIGGIAFPAYPPLAYWLFGASGSIFGFNEFAMRLPTALAALALIAVVANLTRRLAGAEAGLTTAMILATIPTFFVQSGVCRADVITMLFATAAFDRFLAWAEGSPSVAPPEGAKEGGKKTRDLALMYLFTALGILAKGPLAIAVLGLGGLAWFLLRREWKLLLAMKFWIGIPATLLIVVPWYYAMHRLNGPGFLRANLLQENVNALIEGFEQKRPWYFYFRQVLLLLPWLLLIPYAGKMRRSPGVALSAAWFGMVVLFFTISSAKRINYMTYWCPPLAMAAGTTLAALCADAPQLLRKGILGLGGILAAGGILVAALPTTLWTGSGVSKIADRLPLIGPQGGLPGDRGRPDGRPLRLRVLRQSAGQPREPGARAVLPPGGRESARGRDPLRARARRRRGDGPFLRRRRAAAPRRGPRPLPRRPAPAGKAREGRKEHPDSRLDAGPSGPIPVPFEGSSMTTATARATMLPFSRPSIGEEEIREVTEDLRSGWITTGPRTVQFEKDFAAY